MYTNEIFESLLVNGDDLQKVGVNATGKGSRVEALYRCLKSDILCAKFQPGERLIEERLTERYELTSRTPIREVLARLKSEGHVSVRGRSFINPEYSPEALLKLYDVRLALEILAAQQAAINGKSSDLRSSMFLILEAQKNQNSIAVNAADGLFHLKIAEMSGNEALVDHLSRIHEKVFHIRNTFFTEETQEEYVVSAHDLLLAAIERGVPEVAMAEMSHHLNESRQKFEEDQCRLVEG